MHPRWSNLRDICCLDLESFPAPSYAALRLRLSVRRTWPEGGGSARGMFIWLVRIGKKYIHGGFESNRPIVTVIESMWGPVLWGLFKSVSGSGEDREWVESWMWAPGAVNQNRYCRLLRRGIIKKVLSNFTNAGSLFYALATCRWILSLDSYKQLRSNGQELYCTQTHSSGGRKGVKTREARRRGGGVRNNER